MRPARIARKYIQQIDVPPFAQLEMRTTDDVKNEVFGSIEFMTEIEEIGRAHLTGCGQSRNLRTTFLNMQAFVRQAKTYYRSAETLDYRASSLSYYYSFLNLVKAYIATKEPEKIRGEVYHGLIKPRGTRTSDRQIVEVRNGVFPTFYRLVTGQELKLTTRFNVFDLLGYCSDVSLEYEIGKFGRHRITPCRAVVAAEQVAGPYYGLVAVCDFEKLEPHKKTLSAFYSRLEEVNLGKDNCREIFKMYAEEKKRYRFFETRRLFPVNTDATIPMGQIMSHVYDGLKPFFEQTPYPEAGDFTLVAPLRKNLQIPMRESVAIYAVMFFLGSLVRYDPTDLEKILASREAWIFKRFVSTAPITFLRRIRNLIDGRNFIYRSR